MNTEYRTLLDTVKQVQKHIVGGQCSSSLYTRYCNDPKHIIDIFADNDFVILPEELIKLMLEGKEIA